MPPQSLVQECLNRTEKHLWGVVTRGRQLRLLRDSSALTTASYVEFDLEAIFDGELFSESVLLYRLLHVSRFAVADGASPATCWLERWRLDATTSGTRALDQLRNSVRQAITALDTGFLKPPDNTRLREDIDVQALHGALFFHLYGISREDATNILDTFPIVKRKDEAKYGTYRTKEPILAEYDCMAEAGVSLDNPLVDGENYTSTLTPPPGRGPRHAPAPNAGNAWCPVGTSRFGGTRS